MPASILYPVVFLIPRQTRSSRLLLIFRPFMLIPLMFWQAIYGFAANLLTFLAFWAIIFTGRYPRSLWDFVERYFRFRTIVDAYARLLSDRYPPFSGVENDYPIHVGMIYPDSMSRLMVFFRVLIAFPHYLYFMGYSIAYGLIAFLNFWVVLFTGHIPDVFWSFIRKYVIYVSRLRAYLMFLVDEYPPFNGEQSLIAEQEFS